MKKSYLFLLLTVSVLCHCQTVFAQTVCNAVGGVAVAPVSCVLADGSDKDNLLVTEYSTAPANSEDHTFAVLSPEVDEAGDRLIIGITDDGVFDFSTYPTGEYCFTGFAYNQTELDAFVAGVNPLICLLFGSAGGVLEEFCNNAEDSGAPVPIPADLGEVFDVVGAAFDGITIPSVVSALDSVTGLINTVEPLCLGIAETSHCVEVVNNMSDCTVSTKNLSINRFDVVENYPNPFQGSTSILFNSLKPETVTFKVYNLAGGFIHERNIQSHQGKNIFTFDADGYSAGVYFFTLNNGETTVTQRMIVK